MSHATASHVTASLFETSAIASESILLGGITGIVLAVAALLITVYRADKALQKEINEMKNR